MDSSFAFICRYFARLFLKIPKYVNTGQIPAIADVDKRPRKKLFLFYQKQFAMHQQNFALNQPPGKSQLLSSAAIDNLTRRESDKAVKTCRHRDTHGWCGKTQRPCVLLNDLFFKH
jgi:hypothetical protein